MSIITVTTADYEAIALHQHVVIPISMKLIFCLFVFVRFFFFSFKFIVNRQRLSEALKHCFMTITVIFCVLRARQER